MTIKERKIYNTDDLPGEIWKDVKGFEGCYVVSNLGRVKSFERRMHNYIKPARILKLSPNTNYYYDLCITNKEGKRAKHTYIHILVANAFLENPNNYEQVNHKDLDKSNNCVDNLEWVSRQQNILHFRTSDKYAACEYSRSTTSVGKFIRKTLMNKAEIIRLYNNGFSINEVATQLHLGKDFVTDVLRVYGIIGVDWDMNKSILQTEKICFLTGRTDQLHKHHIYGGRNRTVSDKNGFWIYLTAEMHTLSDNAIHSNKDLDLKIKMQCQEEFEKTHSREEFMALIDRNYLG